jgi:glycyl-tRNA synthetase beta chain
LRRACQTVIDILREEEKIQFKDLLRKVIQTYTEKGIEPRGIDELREFIKNRIGLSLREMGVRYDIVNAVLAGDLDDIRDVFQRALALEELREKEEFIPTIMASVRLINILRQGERRGEKIRKEVREQLLLLPEEKELYEKGRKLREKVEKLRENGDYKSVFLEFSSLKDLINRFFDKVLVMTEDDELRANRLALVNSVWQMFFLFGDLSQIVIEG